MVWQEANVNGMELREGKGNVYEVRRKPPVSAQLLDWRPGGLSPSHVAVRWCCWLKQQLIRQLCASCTQKQTVSCDCSHRRAAVAVLDCGNAAATMWLVGRCLLCVLQNGQPQEVDQINLVWVVDSEQLPSYRCGDHPLANCVLLCVVCSAGRQAAAAGSLSESLASYFGICWYHPQRLLCCAVCCVSCRTASHKKLMRSTWCGLWTASSCPSTGLRCTINSTTG